MSRSLAYANSPFKRAISPIHNNNDIYAQAYRQYLTLLNVSPLYTKARIDHLLDTWGVHLRPQTQNTVTEYLYRFLRALDVPTQKQEWSQTEYNKGRWVMHSLMIDRDSVVANIAQQRRTPVDLTKPAAQSARQCNINQLNLKLYAYKLLLAIIHHNPPKELPWPVNSAT